jgi:thiol-disulfide isomerase/thioredoxin
MNTPIDADPVGHPTQKTSCLPLVVIAVAVLAVLFVIALMASFVLLPILLKPPGGREELESKSAPEGHRGVGRGLQQLELYPLTVKGEVLTLPDLRGRIVLLNFWGTWCPPCREELPHIAAIERKFRGQNSFRLLAVSCGRGVQENVEQLRADTKAYLDQQNIDLPAYADPNFISRNAVNEASRFEGYPTTLLLDRQGVIRSMWVGYRLGVEAEMEEQIDRVLAEQ